MAPLRCIMILRPSELTAPTAFPRVIERQRPPPTGGGGGARFCSQYMGVHDGRVGVLRRQLTMDSHSCERRHVAPPMESQQLFVGHETVASDESNRVLLKAVAHPGLRGTTLLCRAPPVLRSSAAAAAPADANAADGLPAARPEQVGAHLSPAARAWYAARDKGTLGDPSPASAATADIASARLALARERGGAAHETDREATVSAALASVSGVRELLRRDSKPGAAAVPPPDPTWLERDERTVSFEPPQSAPMPRALLAEATGGDTPAQGDGYSTLHRNSTGLLLPPSSAAHLVHGALTGWKIANETTTRPATEEIRSSPDKEQLAVVAGSSGQLPELAGDGSTPSPTRATPTPAWRVTALNARGVEEQFDVRVEARKEDRLARAAARGWVTEADLRWVASKLPGEYVGLAVEGIPHADEPAAVSTRQRNQRRRKARTSAIERVQTSRSIKWLGADDHARQVARAELALKHKNSLAASAFVRDMTQSRGGRDILRAPSHLSQTPVRS